MCSTLQMTYNPDAMIRKRHLPVDRNNLQNTNKKIMWMKCKNQKKKISFFPIRKWKWKIINYFMQKIIEHQIQYCVWGEIMSNFRVFF